LQGTVVLPPEQSVTYDIYPTLQGASTSLVENGFSSWLFPAVEDLLQSGFVSGCYLLSGETRILA
jgi:hypothetical protein